MLSYSCDVFQNFQYQWALLTAGTEQDFNTMTIGWGGLGTLWRKPAATVYVKPVRYTYEFMNREDYFTVSFFSEDYRKDLGYLGSHSGKDEDKVSKTGLTPVALEHGVTFKEAAVTLVCKKMYWQDLDPDNMPQDVVDLFYTTEAPHRMYVGEVVEILEG